MTKLELLQERVPLQDRLDEISVEACILRAKVASIDYEIDIIQCKPRIHSDDNEETRIINKCKDCMWVSALKKYCYNSKQKLQNVRTVPAWCPLPVAELIKKEEK